MMAWFGSPEPPGWVNSLSTPAETWRNPRVVRVVRLVRAFLPRKRSRREFSRALLHERHVLHLPPAANFFWNFFNPHTPPAPEAAAQGFPPVWATRDKPHHQHQPIAAPAWYGGCCCLRRGWARNLASRWGDVRPPYASPHINPQKGAPA